MGTGYQDLGHSSGDAPGPNPSNSYHAITVVVSSVDAPISDI
jgi:hypothetical protein